jgi:hypothetical protein
MLIEGEYDRALGDREEATEACPRDELAISGGRRVAAAAVIVFAVLLVAGPALTALASMVAGDLVARAGGALERIPAAASLMVAWRVPAALLLVTALSRPQPRR